MFDYLIVGAGFAGSVLAERLASQLDASVLLVDRRPHIGGNAYDCYNNEGILVHRYGPHIFPTNAKKVFDYLSRFTEWRPYEHRVQSSVDGQLVLTDERGRRVIVPANLIAYVEIAQGDQRRVGFAAS